MRIVISLLISIFYINNISGQINNSTHKDTNKYKIQQLIVPTTFVAYGAVSLYSDNLKALNQSIQSTIFTGKYNKYDDYLQYVPFASVYAINLCGKKGLNNFKDRTIILAISYVIMGGTVQGLKHLTKIERPNHSNNKSFPSGHAATAFMGAEFLFQEYKDVSVWIGISGYLMATAVGYGAMYNNRHWFSDVVAGAGIGILSTKFAYFVYPKIKRLFKQKSSNQVVLPYYDGRNKGIMFIVKI